VYGQDLSNLSLGMVCIFIAIFFDKSVICVNRGAVIAAEYYRSGNKKCVLEFTGQYRNMLFSDVSESEVLPIFDFK